jgi:hypothetical protein
MNETSSVPVSTPKGLSRSGGGILDHAFWARPINNRLHAITGTDAEMGMALQMTDLNGVRLARKTMFHDGSGRYMSAREFIRNEVAAGNVKNAATKAWLNEILKSLD